MTTLALAGCSSPFTCGWIFKNWAARRPAAAILAAIIRRNVHAGYHQVDDTLWTGNWILKVLSR